MFVCACALSRALVLCLLLILTAAFAAFVRIMHVCTLFASDALVGMMAIVILLQVTLHCRISLEENGTRSPRQWSRPARA